jgi:hypothetical protein
MTTILIEPNKSGGWSMRYEGEPIDSAVGNYATEADAFRIAWPQCDRVKIGPAVVSPKAGATTLNRQQKIKKQLEQIRRQKISRGLRIFAICLAVAYVGELLAFYTAGKSSWIESQPEGDTYTFLIESRSDSRLVEMTWSQAIQYRVSHPDQRIYKSSR